jgi:hypothetical protein
MFKKAPGCCPLCGEAWENCICEESNDRPDPENASDDGYEEYDDAKGISIFLKIAGIIFLVAVLAMLCLNYFSSGLKP